MYETILEVDTSRDIVSVQMKIFRDELTGIRMFDAEGNYVIDYTWQDHEESGKWAQEQKIGSGRSIVGLAVNEP